MRVSLESFTRCCVLLFTGLAASCSLHALPDPLITDAAELLPRISAPLDDTFLAEARIEYYGDGQARKGKLTILAEPPERIRLDVLSFTDDLISLMAIEEGHFTYFERGRKECFTGPMCAAPVVAAFPMVNEPGYLLNILVGRIPLLPFPESESVTFSRRQGVYVYVRTDSAGRRQEIHVRPDGLAVAEAILEESGKTVLRVSFEGLIESGDRSVPRTIRLVSPLKKLDLSVEYREVELGYKPTGNPFSYTCPEGTETHSLQCQEVDSHE
jgi:hypothetical protein